MTEYPSGPCPRCGGGIPNSATPGAYPGALSRLDNKTYVCSDCGAAEAMWQFAHPGEPLPAFGNGDLFA